MSAALAAIVFVAFLVETVAGFGATVVAVTLAAFLMPIEAVLVAVVPVNLVLSGYVVARHRASIDRALLFRRIVPWMAIGTAIGMVLVRLRGTGFLKVAFAAFVVVLAIAELAKLRKVEVEARPLPGVVARTALSTAGVIHGLFACGGPLVVWVVGREVEDKHRFRSTLSSLWLLMNLLLVAAWVAGGEVNRGTLSTSAGLLVPLSLGIVLGEAIHAKLPERAFRAAVFALLLVAGVALLARSALS